MFNFYEEESETRKRKIFDQLSWETFHQNINKIIFKMSRELKQ